MIYHVSKLLLRVLVAPAIFLYIAVATILFFVQRKLVYVPYIPVDSRAVVLTPDAIGIPQDAYETVTFYAGDGTQLVGYWIRFSPDKSTRHPTLLYCHANAGNMGHRLDIAKQLILTLESNVFIFSYRGYGHSQGSPSEAGLKLDSERPETDRSSFYVFGQSIGGAVAFFLGNKFHSQIRHLIVENTFLSIPQLIQDKSSFLSLFVPFCREIWNTEQELKELVRKTGLPKLTLLASKLDEIVPVQHMQKIQKILRRKNCAFSFYLLPNAHHNDAPWDPNYFNYVAESVLGDGQ